jgi:hypothetical protein
LLAARLSSRIPKSLEAAGRKAIPTEISYMHAILLTLVTLGGLNGPSQTITDYDAGYDSAQPCAACESGECAGGKAGHVKGFGGGWLGAMPQSCYDPPYGCYPGTRFMHRYPAFHGTYYRRPYNYRNVFDYPWHAGMHEPTSQFSYHVENEEVPTPNMPPVPVPTNARYQQVNPLHQGVRQGLDVSVPTPAVRNASSQLRNLRR